MFPSRGVRGEAACAVRIQPACGEPAGPEPKGPDELCVARLPCWLSCDGTCVRDIVVLVGFVRAMSTMRRNACWLFNVAPKRAKRRERAESVVQPVSPYSVTVFAYARSVVTPSRSSAGSMTPRSVSESEGERGRRLDGVANITHQGHPYPRWKRSGMLGQGAVVVQLYGGRQRTAALWGAGSSLGPSYGHSEPSASSSVLRHTCCRSLGDARGFDWVHICIAVQGAVGGEGGA